MCVMFACSNTLNESFFPSDGNLQYQIYINQNSYALVDYSTLYNDREMEQVGNPFLSERAWEDSEL